MSASTTGANLAATDQGYEDEGIPGVDALQVQQRYGEERAKRLREDGDNQYVDISLSDEHKFFLDDPWVDAATVKDARAMFPNNRCQLLILGAGWGGLLYAIRMVESGMPPEDIRIVDSAGGFGGTWYWNRYPGIACDIESYSYLPLLEETGYIPKLRYSSGEEIREYAERCAAKWGVAESAVFHTKAQKLVWDETTKEWQVELVQHRKGERPATLDIRASFVVAANGVLNWPKLPGFAGILDYKGDIFHSSRWNYAVTGGSPADLALEKLKGKRVAVIGTGCTTIQFAPHVAKWAKHLYVVQRTPASVGEREQRETDPQWFRDAVATSPGWQRERLRNFHQHFTIGQKPAVNLVDDGWTHYDALVGLAGNVAGPRTPDELPAYIQKLHEIDMPRQSNNHRRVEQEVKDPAIAKKLQPYYPVWCKRPGFHEEYLSIFNCENVTLIDTDGKGLDRITEDSIVAGDKSYPVDLIICATGFRSPFKGSPAEKANLTITGRDGKSMSEEWARSGPSTQHGILDRNFPNLFLSGPWQAGTSPNYLFGEDELAKLSAYILAEAKKKAAGSHFTVSPTAEAAEDWGNQMAMRSVPTMALIGCTPSYFSMEGALERLPADAHPILARSGVWGHGIEDFLKVIDAWREEGNLRGIEVQT